MILNKHCFSTLALAAAVLLFLALPFTGCRSVVKRSSDSEAVGMINAASQARDYEQILSLADSYGKSGKLSKGESNYWQGYAHYQMGQRELAEYFWQEAIRVTEQSTDPDDLVYYAKSASFLTSQLCRYAEYAAALHTALPIITRLERIQCDTTSDYTNLLIFAGCSKTYFDKEDASAKEMLERAYQMHVDNIQKKASKSAYRDAVAGIINIAYIWVYVKGYEEGLFWTERLGKLVGEYRDRYPDDTDYIDKQWARYKIFQAISLEGVGRHKEADTAYKEYLQTQFSSTTEGLTNASDFLTVAQRWDEAVASYRTIMEYLQNELNVYSLDNIQRYLLKKYRAHQMLGQQDSINHTARQICEVLDSAILNNRRMDASELHSIHVRDMEILEAEARTARQRGIYTAVVVVILLIAFIIYIVFRRRADQKLRKAHEALQEAYDQLEETTTIKERMESELRIARDIQMSMVPCMFPLYPGLDMYASMRPAREVGGDLYGYLLSDHSLYFAVGDVSGKGVPASLFMAQATRLFQTLAKQGMEPDEICTRINDALSGADNEGSMFVTMFLGLLDLQTGHLSFCNAGHNPPILGDGNHGCDFIKMHPNAPIGVLPGLVFQGEEIESIKGRPLFVYTDGLNEAENPAHEQFGDDRLLGFLRSCNYESARQVIETIADDVERHRAGAEPNDDLTMLCLNIKDKTGE
jgi:serine phosphatase RsbU (regulator of sigma subunit)